MTDVIVAAGVSLALLAIVDARRELRPPELERLEFLAGRWRLHPLPPGSPVPAPPAGEAAGEITYRWRPGTLWLSFDLAAALPGLGPYEVSGGVSFDPGERAHVAYAVNNLAPRLIEYRGQWRDEATLVFDSVGAGERRSRVQYVRRGDGGVVFSASESPDGRAYHTYFEALLTRAGAR
jgi:hypothetical protein